ncbi:hypothetical protein K438DRAFT_1941726 [Mycena galopus ATCC 62051]|nr:hypothetical protein K438DRAFT_1941726 [Mycena galopus ATCC 62051]
MRRAAAGVRMCDRRTRRQCSKAPSSIRTVKVQLAKLTKCGKRMGGREEARERCAQAASVKVKVEGVPCMLCAPYNCWDPFLPQNMSRQEEYKRAQYSKVANGDDTINCELCGAIEMFFHAEACISNIKAGRYHSAEELGRRSSYYEKSCLKGSTSATAILAYQRQFEAIGGAGYVNKTKQSMTVKRQSQEGCCEQRGANVAGGRTTLMGM